MSDNKLKLKALVIPPPPVTYVKLLVIKDLQVGAVTYTKGHTIEVFLQEATRLIEAYGDYFEVVQS